MSLPRTLLNGKTLRIGHFSDYRSEWQRYAPKKCSMVSALIVLLLLAITWGQSTAVSAQQTESADIRQNEYTVKAVFLYSFGRYVEWPSNAFSDASSPFVIGILGEDSFGRTLDEIAAKKTIQGRRIEIRRFASLQDYRQPCHILFVNRSLGEDQQAELVSKIAGTPVMIVGETPGFADRGAVANFYLDGDRVRFEINVDNARKSELRIDARVLSLGKLVGNTKSGASK